jgi:hypothetical protein
MASTMPMTDVPENAAGHRQPGEPCAQETARPGSQGPNAVPGTWGSAGDAGCPLRTKAGQGQGTPRPVPVPRRLERIAPQAPQDPDMACTPLAPPLDVARLERALKSLTPQSAPGVDRVTWQADTANLGTTLVA